MIFDKRLHTLKDRRERLRQVGIDLALDKTDNVHRKKTNQMLIDGVVAEMCEIDVEILVEESTSWCDKIRRALPKRQGDI